MEWILRGLNLSNFTGPTSWDEASLIKFAFQVRPCPQRRRRIDRLNNKLSIALKEFVSDNKVYFAPAASPCPHDQKREGDLKQNVSV